MTGFSIATIRYSMEVTNAFTQALSVGFSAISTFTVTALLVSTIVHAFVLRDLFPNDISIAITRNGLSKACVKHANFGRRRLQLPNCNTQKAYNRADLAISIPYSMNNSNFEKPTAFFLRQITDGNTSNLLSSRFHSSSSTDEVQ
ncbi:hypothetical protein BHM03_00051286 [Ensete ventricosum]|nr:hypothetical protein BHM03_00051286 [Ensete ventricosum]